MSYPVCLDESEEIHSFWHGVARAFYYERYGPNPEWLPLLETKTRLPGSSRPVYQVVVARVFPESSDPFAHDLIIFYAIRSHPTLGCVHDPSETMYQS